MKSFEFYGSGTEYFKIWIVNILFTILTLGIYYPWAKVRNNRYLYSNSGIDEKNFEYHATGMQLFYGYLIAVGFFILYKILEVFFPIISISLIILFIFVIPWLIWRSMKFNLNVTSFNNIHFEFSGGVKESYITFLAIPLLSLIVFSAIVFLITKLDSSIITVIGVLILIAFYITATAYFNIIKTRYLIDFTSYGDAEFETSIDTPEFIKIILKTIFVSLLTFILGGAIIAGIFYLSIDMNQITSLINTFKTDPQGAATIFFTTYLPLIVVLYIFIFAISMTSFAYYVTRQRSYIFENTNLANNVKFSSTMKFIPYAFILLSNFLLVAFTFGLAYPWAKVRVARYTLENTNLEVNDFNGYINSKKRKESAVGEQVSDTFDVGIDIPI